MRDIPFTPMPVGTGDQDRDKRAAAFNLTLCLLAAGLGPTPVHGNNVEAIRAGVNSALFTYVTGQPAGNITGPTITTDHTREK